MRSRQRLNAAIECRHEVGSRATSVLCLGDDSAHRREHVLDAVVELGNQYALLILRSFALGDINVDAHHPLRAAIATVQNKAARVDPPNVAP